MLSTVYLLVILRRSACRRQISDGLNIGMLLQLYLHVCGMCDSKFDEQKLGAVLTLGVEYLDIHETFWAQKHTIIFFYPSYTLHAVKGWYR